MDKETLRDINVKVLEILQMFDEGEIDEQTLKDTIEAELADDLANKADSYGTVMASMDGEIEILKKEIERLQGRVKSITNNKDRMKGYLMSAVKNYIEASGEKNLKGQFYTFGVKKNPPALKIDDETAIPFDYMIPQPPKVDNNRIKEELKGGAKFEFAHLEQGESLTIR